MKLALPGLIWCAIFVLLDAAQAVFLGGVLQGVDGFLLGLLVFGASAVGCGLWAWAARPAQIRTAFVNRGDLIGLNLCTSFAWLTYFAAIQLIEPAVAFTLFSGVIPVATIAAGRIGFPEAAGVRGRLEALGNGVLCLGMVLLAAVTLLGWSGFVRGGVGVAVAGLTLAVVSGCLISGMLLYSNRLDRKGVGPTAQFALRFPLYLVLAFLLWRSGVDAKGAVEPDALLIAWVVGLAVLAFPIYAVQKAVAHSSPATIAAAAAATPAVVFLMQMAEGRVAYAPATLAGLAVYCLGALIAATGNLRSLSAARRGAV